MGGADPAQPVPARHWSDLHHKVFACGSDASACFKSAGTSNPATLSTAQLPRLLYHLQYTSGFAQARINRNQWPPLPSGSRTIFEWKPLIIPSAIPNPVMEAEHSHFSGSRRMDQSPILAVQFQKDCRHFAAFLLVLQLPESILRNNHSWPCFFDLSQCRFSLASGMPTHDPLNARLIGNRRSMVIEGPLDCNRFTQ